VLVPAALSPAPGPVDEPADDVVIEFPGVDDAQDNYEGEVA
jgi:hypothetical protein